VDVLGVAAGITALGLKLELGLKLLKLRSYRQSKRRPLNNN